ncbi:MAG: hypothetical protein AAF614_43760 [Chloroflexota bacterium]
MGQAQSLLVELAEALSIGKEIIVALQEVIDVIEEGVGKFGIGRAVIKATPIEQTLFVYQEELRDIDQQFLWALDLNIPKLTTVMTYHDRDRFGRSINAQERERRGLIRDWLEEDLIPIKNRVAKKQAHLQHMVEDTERKMARLEEKRQRLIHRAWEMLP